MESFEEISAIFNGDEPPLRKGDLSRLATCLRSATHHGVEVPQKEGRGDYEGMVVFTRGERGMHLESIERGRRVSDTEPDPYRQLGTQGIMYQF